LDFTEILKEKKVTAIAYETVQEGERMPLLEPMSQIAGKVAPMVASYFLSTHNNGMGLLIGGASGVLPAKVLIIGSGTVAKNAAKVAAGMGADVVIMGRNPSSMAALEELMPANVSTLYSNRYNIEKILPTVDIVIGAVYVAGEKAQHLITREMLSLCKKGAVLVDVAIDQGGSTEVSKATYHDHPTYVVDGIFHYAVDHTPTLFYKSATESISKALWPFIDDLVMGKHNPILEQATIIRNAKIIDERITRYQNRS